MKEILSPYIDRVTWKNFELVPLGGGRVAKYEFGGGVGENKDMKHVNKKKLLSPYIGRGTWKNFKLVPQYKLWDLEKF